MKLHHYGILLLTLLLLGLLLGYSFVRGELVPVAAVGTDIIFLREVKENMEVLQKVFAESPEFIQDADLRELSTAKGPELFERTLEASIMNRVAEQAASKKERESARELAEQYLARAGKENVSAFAKQGYGWSVTKFRERILEPQALREVQLKEKQEGYEEWLLTQRRAADVKIWFVPYEWRDGELAPE